MRCTSRLRFRLAAAAVLIASTSLTVSAGPAEVDANRLAKAGTEPENWLTHAGTYAEQRHSALDQITPENVGQLRLAWYHDLDTNRGQEATPLVVDGVLYTTAAWSKVLALDAKTGKLLWQYDPTKLPLPRAATW